MLNFSLKNKIILSVIIAIIVAGAVATYSVFVYSKNILVEKENEVILIEAIKISHEVEHILSINDTLIKRISEDAIIKDVLREGVDVHEKLAMHLIYYSSGFVSDIFLVDAHGNVVSSTNEDVIGKDVSSKGYFKNTLLNKKGCVVAAVDDITRELGYYLTSPIETSEGEMIGIAVIRIGREAFEEALTTTDKSGDLKLMLANKHGIIIFADVIGRELKSLGELEDSVEALIDERDHFPDIKIDPIQYQSVQEVIDDEEEIKLLTFLDKIDGESELLAIKKTGEYPFFVVIETDEDIYVAEAVRIAYILSILVALSAISAGLFIYFIVSYQLSPLDKLSELVIKVARGDYTEKMAEIKGSREISDLAEAFNVMLLNVKKSRDEINKKVEEQTININKSNRELEKQKVAIMNILEDVSEEKKATENLASDLEKFKLAVENASDHIVITDIEGIVLYVNKAVEKITGFKKDEVVGKKAGTKELWGGLMKRDVYKKFWKIIKEDKQVFIGEFTNKRKNGEEYVVSASVSPILNKKGEVMFFVGIERDITKEKDVDRAKTEFVSLASHQLRTPLTAINWYVEMMMSGDAGKISKDQKNYLEEVYKGSKRMVELVNSLLNVSRIDLGTFAIDPEPTDFVSVSRDVLAELKPSITKKKMKIKEIYDTKLPLINADPKLLRIVFQNLLSNAVKYTPENGKVVVEIKKDEKDVLITVSDNGYGIPKSQQSRIFEKLFRADNARQKETDGTGLGLYVLRSIIEKNNGKVWFDSIENNGTTFYVRMPLTGMMKKEGAKGLS